MKRMSKIGRIVIWLLLTAVVMAGSIALCAWLDWPMLGSIVVYVVIPVVSMGAYSFFVDGDDTQPASPNT
ncbi:hypothetical protein DZC31_30210 (plasmid) [Stenotrophomonas rhizophila]|nr:hypothetical protein DZC31_30210 [Stenotrophomonas rhizophila]